MLLMVDAVVVTTIDVIMTMLKNEELFSVFTSSR